MRERRIRPPMRELYTTPFLLLLLGGTTARELTFFVKHQPPLVAELLNHFHAVSDPSSVRYGAHLTLEQTAELQKPAAASVTAVERHITRTDGLGLSGHIIRRSLAGDKIVAEIPEASLFPNGSPAAAHNKTDDYSATAVAAAEAAHTSLLRIVMPGSSLDGHLDTVREHRKRACLLLLTTPLPTLLHHSLPPIFSLPLSLSLSLPLSFRALFARCLVCRASRAVTRSPSHRSAAPLLPRAPRSPIAPRRRST